jgi:hypothetical protein
MHIFTGNLLYNVTKGDLRKAFEAFVQGVWRFEERLLVWNGDPNTIPIKGREFIWVDTTARWRIAGAKRFLEHVTSEEGAQSRLNDIIDSVVFDQVSRSELVELVRSATWEVPEDEVLKDIPKEREEELKRDCPLEGGSHPMTGKNPPERKHCAKEFRIQEYRAITG